MGTTGKNEKKPKILAPAGLQKLRCIHVIDMGTQENSFKNNKYLDHQIRFTFELSECLHVFDKDKGPQPFCISPFPFSANLGTKKTAAFFESWMGRPFTKEEKEKGFDFASMLNKAGMGNIMHKPKKSDPSKIFEEISSISPMMKGSSMVKHVNPLILYSIGAADQWEVFEKLNKYVQGEIMKSPEWQSEAAKSGYVTKTEEGTATAATSPEEIDEEQF